MDSGLGRAATRVEPPVCYRQADGPQQRDEEANTDKKNRQDRSGFGRADLPFGKGTEEAEVVCGPVAGVKFLMKRVVG